MNILCWGDSNTYGYDPRGLLGGRYEADSRWCDLLENALGCSVLNGGENGRTTPLHPWENQAVLKALDANGPVDLLILMLGTNDLILGCQDSLSQIADRMDRLVSLVQEQAPATKLLLLAPPPVRLATGEPAHEVDILAGLYARVAKQRGVFFCDPGSWGLSLAYDGVHLSPEGHRTFAGQLERFLRTRGLV